MPAVIKAGSLIRTLHRCSRCGRPQQSIGIEWTAAPSCCGLDMRDATDIELAAFLVGGLVSAAAMPLEGDPAAPGFDPPDLDSRKLKP